MKSKIQLIVDASDVIADYYQKEKRCFDLFFINGQFTCSDHCHASQMQFFLRHFTVAQAEAGLTSPQWLKIGNKAEKLIKESAE